ncbi:MAG TPA: hypothetical protein DCZ44_05060 [Flavobacteriaceae bacterium]|nr:hypothetical protein [Flavobacteriaceae bacterium]
MKTYLKALSTFCLFFGLLSQPMFGQQLQQDNSRPDEAAKIQVDQLSQSLNLDGSQQRALFRALVSESTRSGQSPQVLVNKANNDQNQAFTQTLKSILTPEQFRKWKNPDKK